MARGTIEVGTLSVLNDAGTISYKQLQCGTTAQRPTLASTDRADRWNTDLLNFEFWDGTTWSTPLKMSGTNGSISFAGASSATAARTVTFPDRDVTIGNGITLMTAVATTSGTAIDFTGIPSWAKKITVMFNGTSTNGSSAYLVQAGSGSIQATGYLSNCSWSSSTLQATNGFVCVSNITASTNQSGVLTLFNQTGNSWVSSSLLGTNSGANALTSGIGNVSLSGVLDRIRITTVNGTDTFDAGSINIMYEG